MLIVNDDEGIRKTFTRILKRNGYQSDTAATGKEAIQKSKAKFYAFAIVDVCLADMNGVELLNKLDDHGRKMVKIIITGFPAMAPVKGTHADAYLLKPFKPQVLLSIIKEKVEESNP